MTVDRRSGRPLPTLVDLAYRWSPILRWRYLILALVAVGGAWRGHLAAGHDDWPYFLAGSELLFGGHRSGGLHLYANFPDIQIGN